MISHYPHTTLVLFAPLILSRRGFVVSIQEIAIFKRHQPPLTGSTQPTRLHQAPADSPLPKQTQLVRSSRLHTHARFPIPTTSIDTTRQRLLHPFTFIHRISLYAFSCVCCVVCHTPHTHNKGGRAKRTNVDVAEAAAANLPAQPELVPDAQLHRSAATLVLTPL